MLWTLLCLFLASYGAFWLGYVWLEWEADARGAESERQWEEDRRRARLSAPSPIRWHPDDDIDAIMREIDAR